MKYRVFFKLEPPHYRMPEPISFKEQRVRGITQLYYSRPEIIKAIFDFSQNREISPRYFEGFGKRPDSFQYEGDIFEMVKKGATSFHCSEELWEDPLNIVTGMKENELNNIRIGWDLLIDLDCKWIDFSKKAAEAIIRVFNKHNIYNIGIKFSGSKGFHILIPWKAFPKEIGGEETKNLFPDLPRKLVAYIRFKAEQEMKEIITEEELAQFKNTDLKRGRKCNVCKEVALEYNQVNHICPKCRRQEIRRVPAGDKIEYKCPDCRRPFEVKEDHKIFFCNTCKISSDKEPNNFSRNVEVDLFELMGLDLVLVSPRHLFRMPYSLHEKTALSSVVIDPKKVGEFDLMDAAPMKVQVKDFTPNSKENEANELVREALDWSKGNQLRTGQDDEKLKGKYANYKPIILKDLEDSQFPPCVKKILEGLADGRQRSVFILINFFRSIGMEKEEMEKRIYEWNEKNQPPLKEGILKSQLMVSYRRKPLMPPNCREYYQGVGVCIPNEFCSNIKNPVNYTVKKNLMGKKKSSRTSKSNKFKKKN